MVTRLISSTMHDIRVRNVMRAVEKTGRRYPGKGSPSVAEVTKTMGYGNTGQLYSHVAAGGYNAIEELDRAWKLAGYVRGKTKGPKTNSTHPARAPKAEPQATQTMMDPWDKVRSAGAKLKDALEDAGATIPGPLLSDRYAQLVDSATFITDALGAPGN